MTSLQDLIELDDALSIFVWSRRDQDSFVDAYGDFPKGMKMKLKNEVRRLETEGQKLFADYLAEFCGDDLWIEQTLEEIGPDNLSYILEVYKNE
jgi:hypothetical protein|tara:strand:- start:842 stop:1123 length:282 start_codon:yes stop_codon:yes gene_type:complete